METNVVITTTDNDELANILGFLATKTNITKTKYAVTNNSKDHVAKIYPSLTPTPNNDSVQTRENDTINVVGNQTIDIPLVGSVKQQQTDRIPNNIMDEYIMRHFPSPTPTLHNEFKDLRIVPYDTEDMTSEDEMETGEWAKKYDWDGRRLLQCRKCDEYVRNDKLEVEMHATFLHANLNKYECCIKGCGEKSQFEFDMFHHYNEFHPNNSCYLKSIEWTSEEHQISRNTIKACFPEFGTKSYRKTCQKCHEVMVKNSDTERRIHSICHLKLKLYKCDEPNCKFETIHPDHMKYHGSTRHQKSIVLRDMKIKLTEKQEIKIAIKMMKCFPD